MAGESCNIWEETILALQSDEVTPTKMCAWTIAFVVAITFVTSSLTGNYSQVDKLWSVIPFVYCWIVVTDARTVLMAIVATLWGVRLTWNFNRRGGYKWPMWDGDEDYRWKHLQDGALLGILRNKVAVSSMIAEEGLFMSISFHV
jgi:steroid 5-alpha reductase family enzyme